MATAASSLRGRPRGAAGRCFERNLATAHWPVFVSGFFEPLFYLFSLGVGVGRLVGDVVLDGQSHRYAAFVAPAMLASSAMNGAVTTRRSTCSSS